MPGLITAIVLLGFFTILIGLFKNNKRYKKNYNSSDYRQKQLQLVSSNEAKFTVQPIMNKGEYKLFYLIERKIIPNFANHRLFAQTCLGEIIKTPNPRVRSCFNSKRVDMLITNGFGYPIVAIEYQGSGHYQGSATVRDAIKREVCRKAGVAYLEIHENYTEKDVIPLIEMHLKEN